MKMQRNLPWVTFLCIACIGACFLLLPRPQIIQNEPYSSDENGITQVATIDSLLAGMYDGEMTLKELRRYGDFGIGTFQSLDGEMLLLDGTFYQVKGDGLVYYPDLETTTPFAAVFPFPKTSAGGTIKTSVGSLLNYEELCKKIDKLAPNLNVPIAVRLEGLFSGVRTRSVPAQDKPYKPLAEVTKNQPEFNLGTLEGDVIGYRLPPYIKGLNVPGYHLHFLSLDRKEGGHLLQLNMEKGSIEIAEAHRFQVVLPKRIADFSRIDLSKDRSEELEKVEK